MKRIYLVIACVSVTLALMLLKRHYPARNTDNFEFPTQTSQPRPDVAEHIYICTGANSRYYPHVLNLIGSIHKTNFYSLKEVMVADLGLTPEQRDHLNTIQKTVVCDLEKTHPDILKIFEMPRGRFLNWFKCIIPGRKMLGWYAWKPVATHQALQKYPHVLWLDAGTTVLGQLDDLMKHVAQNGYFLATIGDELQNGRFPHDNNWETTQHVRKKFNLDAAENKWILDQESVMSGLYGSTKEAYDLFVKDWYEATFDLKNFADDGTTPCGYGTGRHDQTYLSILAYTKGLHISKQDHTQKNPTMLRIDNKDVPFYITWNSKFVSEKTQIYNSRFDVKEYKKYIRYK